jgi:hypothetical protein
VLFGAAAILPLAATFVVPGSTEVVLADAVKCDMSQYKAASGLTATVEPDALVVAWNGENGQELRARFAIESGTPSVRELAVRKGGGPWAAVGQNLTPEYHVVSGIRRMSVQQAEPLVGAGVELTPAVIDKNRWYAFWDAPLVLPDGPEMQQVAAARGARTAQPAGQTGPPSRGINDAPAAAPAARGRTSIPGVPPGARNIGPARSQADIHRADASFHATSCTVKTDGQSIEVTYPGLSMGIFAGDLRFTAYKGTNLLRMDALAKTSEPWIAYKYDAGLKGFSTALTPRVAWRDTGGHPQSHAFGGVVDDALERVKAQNRLMVAEGSGRSIATFPPPHTFFFTREKDTNLGYVWYRKDAEGRFGFGVGMPDREEDTQYVENFALYNAPPGTVQKMGMYFYATAESGDTARQQVLAYTHGDTFKPLAGYKTFVNHFHLDFTGRQRATGSLGTPSQDLAAMKTLGLNIIGLSDFHFELHPNDPGPLRFKDEKDYFEATRRSSDADFLVTPWEEPSAYFGGHYNIMFPKRVYWSKVRKPDQPFTENDPVYGKVYHTANADDVQRMMDLEGAYWYHAHPRTKGTTGFPDLIFDKPWVKNDRYLGVAFKPGMGQDQSEARLCEWRCFDTVDTMNNIYAGTGLQPKYIIADIDTYKKGPEDDTYANFPVNYLRLDKVPGPDEDWTPILKAMHDGDFFVSTGEILIKSYSVGGSGTKRTINADVEWTFPLSFVEVVWGDGKAINRQVISATDLGANGTKKFSIPFDAAGKVWVRFAVWDSAGDGAFVQPIWLTPSKTTTASSR